MKLTYFAAADIRQNIQYFAENLIFFQFILAERRMKLHKTSNQQPSLIYWHLHRTHTHTHTFNGPFSGTIQVSQYQKGKTNPDFTEATDSEWQWHQLGHMQVCTSLQTDNHTSTSPLSFFTGWMPFLLPNRQKH